MESLFDLVALYIVPRGFDFRTHCPSYIDFMVEQIFSLLKERSESIRQEVDPGHADAHLVHEFPQLIIDTIPEVMEVGNVLQGFSVHRTASLRLSQNPELVQRFISAFHLETERRDKEQEAVEQIPQLVKEWEQNLNTE